MTPLLTIFALYLFAGAVIACYALRERLGDALALAFCFACAMLLWPLTLMAEYKWRRWR